MKKQLKQKLTRCLSLLLTLVTLCNLSVSALAASPALSEGAYVFYTINKAMNLNILYKGGVGAELGTDHPSGESNEIILVNHVKNTYSWAKFRSANQAVSVYTAKNYKLR